MNLNETYETLQRLHTTATPKGVPRSALIVSTLRNGGLLVVADNKTIETMLAYLAAVRERTVYDPVKCATEPEGTVH